MTETTFDDLSSPDWRAKIATLSGPARARLAERARNAPLFAHAYAFHLNMRFGGVTPLQLAEFAYEQRLVGLKVHVEDGEAASLAGMSDAALSDYGAAVEQFGLELHIETSTTQETGLSDAVRIALATGATSLRCYPRYEGRVSEIVSQTIADLRRLETFDPEGRLRYTLEQHEDLKSEELIGIVKAVANPRLGLLFDFGNMINAYELPLPALAAQAPYVTEVHVKDCLVQQDRDGWAHLACQTGTGHLPLHAMFVDLLLLGQDRPQVLSFGLEEEEGYFAPALRFPSEESDPFIAARSASFTDIGTTDLGARLRQEAIAAHRQLETVRTMLNQIAAEALRIER
ncbi:sugar phosphate isomerase/epimerase [Ensifer sp. ENS07]|uniref:sugar phosphate isomerase/epimerase family protein n=1 Tax=Ensifer TaxID=106591 RepID=UPI000DD9CD50|nr:TIM barrel protein [Ensifer sp. ENS07]MBD9638682.1 sugar phosphate isomerase/epimerase [Ensifer sp. ENS07]